MTTTDPDLRSRWRGQAGRLEVEDGGDRRGRSGAVAAVQLQSRLFEECLGVRVHCAGTLGSSCHSWRSCR